MYSNKSKDRSIHPTQMELTLFTAFPNSIAISRNKHSYAQKFYSCRLFLYGILVKKGCRLFRSENKNTGWYFAEGNALQNSSEAGLGRQLRAVACAATVFRGLYLCDMIPTTQITGCLEAKNIKVRCKGETGELTLRCVNTHREPSEPE